jgi:hypothetical protein
MHVAARGVADFAEAPTALRRGDKVQITFAAKAPVDAEVSMIDA